jgi:hypothetical protein
MFPLERRVYSGISSEAFRYRKVNKLRDIPFRFTSPPRVKLITNSGKPLSNPNMNRNSKIRVHTDSATISKTKARIRPSFMCTKFIFLKSADAIIKVSKD